MRARLGLNGRGQLFWISAYPTESFHSPIQGWPDNRGSTVAIITHTVIDFITLCWEIEELKALTESGRRLLIEMEVLIDVLRGNDEEHNLPRRIRNLKNELIDFVKRLTRFKRVPATHIFVIMISSELRRSKRGSEE